VLARVEGIADLPVRLYPSPFEYAAEPIRSALERPRQVPVLTCPVDVVHDRQQIEYEPILGHLADQDPIPVHPAPVVRILGRNP